MSVELEGNQKFRADFPVEKFSPGEIIEEVTGLDVPPAQAQVVSINRRDRTIAIQFTDVGANEYLKVGQKYIFTPGADDSAVSELGSPGTWHVDGENVFLHLYEDGTKLIEVS